MKEKTFNEKIAEYNKGVDETPENILSPEMKEEAKEKFKQKSLKKRDILFVKKTKMIQKDAFITTKWKVGLI